MPRRDKRSKGIRRKRNLKATNAGPVLALLGTIIAILGALSLIVFVALPALLPMLGFTNLPWQPTPTPAPTVRPTPTPNPLLSLDPLEIQHEVLLSSTGEDQGYQWFADPYAYANDLFFTAGHLVDSNIHMDALYQLDMQTGSYEKLSAPRTNQDYVYPTANENWLVYLDAKPEGGGHIRAIDRRTGDDKIVKTAYAGQPRFSLDGDTLAWVERTGSWMDKVFVCDLNTLESTAIRLFNNTPYGQSSASIAGGELLYADEAVIETGKDGEALSSIVQWNIAQGKMTEYEPGTYVHDPITNGRQWVWRNGLHGENDSLYWTQNAQPAKLIAEGIVDFGLSSAFAAYSKDYAVYIYLFQEQKAICITPEGERAQLLGVSNGVVIWMDVSSYDRDIMKYARLG